MTVIFSEHPFVGYLALSCQISALQILQSVGEQEGHCILLHLDIIYYNEKHCIVIGYNVQCIVYNNKLDSRKLAVIYLHCCLHCKVFTALNCAGVLMGV